MLPLVHIIYQDIPKWYCQPKPNETATKVCVESPHSHNKLEDSHH